MIKKYICLILLIVIFIPFSFAERYNEELWQQKDSGELHFAVLDFDYYPWIFEDAKGELQGIDILLARELAKSIEVKPVFHRSCSNFAEMMELVNSGNIDIGISVISKTVDREFYVMQSEPYLKLDIKVLIDRIEYVHLKSKVFDSTSIIEILNLEDSYIGIIAPSWYEKLAKKIMPNAFLKNYQTSEKMFSGLFSNEVVAILSHEIDVNYFLEKHLERELYYESFTLPYQDQLCMQIDPSKPELRDLINVFIESNNNPYKNLSSQELLTKYFSEDKNENDLTQNTKNIPQGNKHYFLFLIILVTWILILLFLKKNNFSEKTIMVVVYLGSISLAIYAGLTLPKITELFQNVFANFMLIIIFFVFVIIFNRIILCFRKEKNLVIYTIKKTIPIILILSCIALLIGIVTSQIVFDDNFIYKINITSNNILNSTAGLGFQTYLSAKSQFGNELLSLRFLPIIFLLLSFTIAYAISKINKGRERLLELTADYYNLSIRVLFYIYKLLPLFVFIALSSYITNIKDYLYSYGNFFFTMISLFLLLSVILIFIISRKLELGFFEFIVKIRRALVLGLSLEAGILVYPILAHTFQDSKNINIEKFKIALPIFFIIGGSVAAMSLVLTILGAANLYDITISLRMFGAIFAVSLLSSFLIGASYSFNAMFIIMNMLSGIIIIPDIGLHSVFGIIFTTLMPFITILHILTCLLGTIYVSMDRDNNDKLIDDKFQEFVIEKFKSKN